MRSDRRDGWPNERRAAKPVPPGIAPGRRFVAADFYGVVWEVVAVARHFDEPMPHARLARVGAPHDTKTVSVAVLADRRYYRSADGEEG